MMTDAIDLSSYFHKLDRIAPTVSTGVVTELIGLLVESNGPAAAIGDFCEIRTYPGRNIRTQVIGFRNGRVLSMPLEETDGLQLGDPIVARGDEAKVPVGPGLLGRVLDGFGQPMDGGTPIEPTALYDLYCAPPSPLDREHIVEQLVTGVRVIDALTALRQRAADGYFRRQRRRQEHSAGCDVEAKFGRRHRHRADRRTEPRGPRVSGT